MQHDVKDIRLNIGCGEDVAEGWLNIDISVHAILSRCKPVYLFLCKIAGVKPTYYPKNILRVDARRKLPYCDNSVKAVFSSHLLEHLTYEEASNLINEIYRCLCPGGIVRIIVPDLFQIVKKYMAEVASSPSPESSHSLLSAIGVMRYGRSGISKLCYGLFSNQGHQYMYDEHSLAKLMTDCGFSKVERKGFGESGIEGVSIPERKERHFMAVCLEGRK